MPKEYKNAVMDVFPWPHGQGFTGAELWWDYVLTLDEQKRLDSLLGAALLDEKIRECLLSHGDDSLLAAFGISPETQRWLRAVKADTLADLAQAILAEARRATLAVASEAA
jgi:hypothetical protein